jgi:sulfatase maturation enzyme AslB (radical SAM superfamily)
MDWKLMITKMVMVKSQISEADKDKIWPYNFPKVAATDADVQKLKETVKDEIPQNYIDFLKTANGWKAFFQFNDLLGTSDLLNSQYKDILQQEFYELEEAYIDGVSKEDLLPIAVNPFDRDLFFIVLSKGKLFGQVIWFAGEEVERFKDFQEFFASMLAYNERELCKLKGLPV